MNEAHELLIVAAFLYFNAGVLQPISGMKGCAPCDADEVLFVADCDAHSFGKLVKL